MALTRIFHGFECTGNTPRRWRATPLERGLKPHVASKDPLLRGVPEGRGVLSAYERTFTRLEGEKCGLGDRGRSHSARPARPPGRIPRFELGVISEKRPFCVVPLPAPLTHPGGEGIYFVGKPAPAPLQLRYPQSTARTAAGAP